MPDADPVAERERVDPEVERAAKEEREMNPYSPLGREDGERSLAKEARDVLSRAANGIAISSLRHAELRYVAYDNGGVRYLSSTGEQLQSWKVKELGALPTYVANSRPNGDSKGSLILFVEESLIDARQFPLESIPSDVTIYVVFPDGSYQETVAWADGDVVHRQFEWQRSHTLVYDVREGHFPRELPTSDALPFSASDVRILTLLDPNADRNTVVELNFAARGRGVDMDVGVTRADVDKAFRAASFKTLLIVGHNEKGQFVLYGSDNRPRLQVSLAVLSKLAKDHHVSAYFLGCETGPGGFTHSVNSLDIAAQLKRALGAETYEQFWASLGTPEAPFLITSEQVGQAIETVFRRQRERQRGAAVGAPLTMTITRLTVLNEQDEGKLWVMLNSVVSFLVEWRLMLWLLFLGVICTRWMAIASRRQSGVT